MNDEEVIYEVDCDVCDVVSRITVVSDDEVPAFCPMCGSPMEAN